MTQLRGNDGRLCPNGSYLVNLQRQRLMEKFAILPVEAYLRDDQIDNGVVRSQYNNGPYNAVGRLPFRAHHVKIRLTTKSRNYTSMCGLVFKYKLHKCSSLLNKSLKLSLCY
ncbi:unnamed protein product [Schistosoma spindalis]|nr:unnamed protein product [Schistosoma spindale]